MYFIKKNKKKFITLKYHVNYMNKLISTNNLFLSLFIYSLYYVEFIALFRSQTIFKKTIYCFFFFTRNSKRKKME